MFCRKNSACIRGTIEVSRGWNLKSGGLEEEQRADLQMQQENIGLDSSK